MPVSNPSTDMITGNINGEITSNMAKIIAPLIMFPNKRTAKASVRDNSPMTLKGSIKGVGCV